MTTLIKTILGLGAAYAVLHPGMGCATYHADGIPHTDGHRIGCAGGDGLEMVLGSG